MSWAPYFHPSGEYLIFTTTSTASPTSSSTSSMPLASTTPVRVTTTDGFDGLPVFTPDGKKLSWTSGRGSGGASQIYIGDWDHDHALAALGLKTDPQA
jgi:Tol biopolymer transport system component